MTQPSVEVAEVGLPPIEVPRGERPEISAHEFEARIAALLGAVEADCVVVYADREHAANLTYLCNFDPRFEEAILVLAGGRRTLLVGKEGVVYAAVVPIPVDVVCCPTFSLMGIDRSGFPTVAEALREAGVVPGASVAVIGWKSIDASESLPSVPAIFVPSFVVDTLRHLAGDAALVRDETAVLTSARHGQRMLCSADQIAAFEWGAARCSQWVMAIIAAARPGASGQEAFQAAPWDGEPLSLHPVFASGPGITNGLTSPSARRLELGDAVVGCVGLWGGNCARGGTIASGPSDLGVESEGYIDQLVAPYWQSMAAWYEALSVGARGGDVFDTVIDALAGQSFAPSLNPGHLIHYEEWLNSPIRDGSDDPIQSGMVLQSDIIPTGIRPGWVTNCEDTVAIADAELRAELAAKHPELWARVEARRAFVRDSLGVSLGEDVLPLTATVLHLPPYWLEPGRSLARA
jgi:hypothetical protein